MSNVPIYPPVIPGILECPSLNMLAGASGLGKTALLAGIVRCLLDGTPLFGEAITIPPAVGYLSADRTGTSEWFSRAKVQIPQYSLIDDKAFDLKQLHGGKHGPLLLAHCLEKVGLPPGSVVIVDPIALFLGGKLNDYNAVAIACIEIQRMLLSLPYTLIGVCHTSKLKADVQDRYARPQDRILGSAALLGYSSTQMYLMGPDESGREDGKYTFVWNPHFRPAGEFHLTRKANGLFDLAKAKSAAEPEEPAAPKSSSSTTSSTHPHYDEKLAAIEILFPLPPDSISTAQLLLKVSQAVAPGSGPISRAQFFRDVDKLVILKRVRRVKTGVWERVPPEAEATGTDTPPVPPSD